MRILTTKNHPSQHSVFDLFMKGKWAVGCLTLLLFTLLPHSGVCHEFPNSLSAHIESPLLKRHQGLMLRASYLNGPLPVSIGSPLQEQHTVLPPAQWEFTSIPFIPVSESSEQELTPKLRSPFLGGFFSMIIPGLGQAYAESYWKAIGFLAIEAGLWVGRIYYLNKGHRAEQQFVAVANERWSPVRYAERLKLIYQNDMRLAGNGRTMQDLVSTIDLQAVGRYDFRTLNQFERVALYANGFPLSHTLPSFGSQQYYELIGKYNNFFIGWDDYDETKLSAEFQIHSSFGRDYARIRQDANDILGRASTFASIIIINHLLSLADAVWSVNRYNAAVRATLLISADPLMGSVQPEVRLSVSF